MDFPTKLGLALAVAGLGVSIAFFFVPVLWREIPRWIATVGVITGVSLCVLAIACFALIPAPAEPEVTLRFVGRTSPDLQLTNISDVTADHVKYMVVAFDADAADEDKLLKIPATEFGFLTAHNSSLPINLFDLPANPSSVVKAGDRIFGSASVSCPTCSRGHTFLFNITLGNGGWYIERKDVSNGNFIAPANKAQLKEFGKWIQGLTDAERISITDIATR